MTNTNFIIFLLISLLFNQDIFEGYTLFTPGVGSGGQSTTYLKDNNLNNIQTWNHSRSPASMPYLIAGSEPGWENTLLVYPYRVHNPTMLAGGVGGAFEVLTWNGDLVWEYELSNENYQHHHDIEPLPNGNILLIAFERKTLEEAYQAGRTFINNTLNEMWSTAIFEIQHNGNGGGEIVWEWHLWDHLIQDACPDCSNYGVVSEHPELFDINKGNVGTPNGFGDWMHVNTISYNIYYNQIVLSSSKQNEIFVIDHSTSTLEAAGHTGGNYNRGGDFLYRWGNPQNYNRGDGSNRMLGHQHGINWIPNGYPGEGNFILLNNDTNEAFEFIPPMDNEGNYLIEDNQPYGPDYTVWNSSYLSTAMQGGAFRLPNGNTLLTDCDNSTIKEITEVGSTVWTYSIPGAGETNNIQIARAQKYSLDYFDNINNLLLGDINNDGIINILDAVQLVNIILINEYSSNVDMDQDGIVNILDIVQLVNIILN